MTLKKRRKKYEKTKLITSEKTFEVSYFMIK